MTENPYSTPLSDQVPAPDDGNLTGNAEDSATLMSIAKVTFLAWELLRIPFVIVLGLLTLLLSGPHLLRQETLFVIVVGAVFANLCFFAGPVVETYVRWLGYDRKWVRWFLFLGGTALTAMLAAATLVAMFFPSQF